MMERQGMNQAMERQANQIGGCAVGPTGGYAAAMGQCAEARQTAKGLLRQRVSQLRREADKLEALAKALPEELPHGADDALYDLLTRAR